MNINMKINAGTDINTDTNKGTDINTDTIIISDRNTDSDTNICPENRNAALSSQLAERSAQLLAFPEICQMLAERAVTEQGKGLCVGLRPYLRELELRKNLRDTSQARELLDRTGNPPIPGMERVEEYLNKAVSGELLMPEEIGAVGIFLVAVKRMSEYLEHGKQYQNSIAYYNENLALLEELKETIERTIRNNRIDDYASGALRDIRRGLVQLEEKMRAKAEAIQKSQKQCMAESFIVNRNGRLCLPVRRDYKYAIPGTVVDKSSTGATLFIEPAAIAKLREEYEILQIEEENEEHRILYTLMGDIAEHEVELRADLGTIIQIDFMFAKGKLSVDMEAVAPEIHTDRYIRVSGARHPMLQKESCVPLDFVLGHEKRGMIITGPNTGGKTVSIKTVGLFCMMACAGLHLPCESADICMNNQVLCDIGDGQNMQDNLSTFSAHIKNVIEILKRVTKDSLVIMDELGSGTDPAEGMGIAISILEKLRESGCLYLVTTHYPEVKIYAGHYAEIENARMSFDRENLKPLYKLEIGKAGDSCALYIAKRLGLPEDMLELAAREAHSQWSSPSSPARSLERIPVPHIERIKTGQMNRYINTFQRGDSVTVMPEKVIGIVVQPANAQGDVLVQIKKEKLTVNHKRLQLKVAASQLYPEDYDFSIIFDSVEVRKAHHQMERKYVEGEIKL